MVFDIENNEFQMAFELIEKTNETFFLTGKAGTGKSTFLKYIVESINKNFIVVAPTGIAAVNAGGVTIHSFFQFPLRPLLPEDEDIKVFWKESEKRKIISAMDTLIIDEISMVRADLIDGIDYSLRRNGGNPNLPFGGKQVVFVGDIFQLEPVTVRNSGELKIINELYGNAHFYNANVFQKVELFTVELKIVYRQTESEFINLLDKVRIKEILTSDIEKINTRFLSEKELEKEDFSITLTTRNELAERVNQSKLNQLVSQPLTYSAEVSGEFEESKFPTDPELTLKEGSQVIFIKNDSEKRWVNGTIGQVCNLTETEVNVKLEDGSIYTVEPKIWENIKYQYNKDKKKIEEEIVGTFKQIPLKLAWAITIHKSQGLTFDKVVIDFGSGTFASGQAYVALSRATSLSGLFLKRRMHSSDIIIDAEIKEFAKTFNDLSVVNSKLEEGSILYTLKLREDFEKIGKHYLKKAVESIIDNRFNEAYDFIILGYEQLTCDCKIGDWFNEDLIKIFSQAQSFDCTLSKLELIKTFVFINSEKYDRALNAIESFIEYDSNNELGYYFKGKAFLGLENYDDAISCFNQSLEIRKTNKSLYRLGRTKEQYLNLYGLEDLYEATINNISSTCCCRELKEYSYKREIKLPTLPFTETKDFLTIHFNEDRSEYVFQMFLNKLFKDEFVFYKEKFVISKEVIGSFLDSLKENQGLFRESSNEFEDENYYDDYDYSPSYERYGGAYGFDDDTIDTAFEGDPENYWNID